MLNTSLATAARYEEDTAAASGDVGALVLAVRNDAGGSLVDANGDYAPLQVNILGELVVGGLGGGGLVVVAVQPVHDLLNCNANIQVGDVDVSNANPVPVSDAGGSLTVDNATLSVVGGGTEAAAQRVTIANDSTGLLSVDDNGGSLTIDQATHDNLNCNANIQVGDVDVGPANLVPVDVANHVETAFDHGSNSAIGLVATQLIVAATPAVLGVEVKAANANTANIYIGNVDVTAATVDATDGMELGPGESILVRIDDVNKLYAIAAAGVQRVFWLRV